MAKEITDFFTAEDLEEFTIEELKELMDEYEIEYKGAKNKADHVAVARQYFVKDEGLEALANQKAPEKGAEEPKEENTALGKLISPADVTAALNAARVKATGK